MDQITIRNMRVEEYATLKDLLYEAIYVPPGDAPPPRSVADRPELRIYFQGFGSGPLDRALAAVDGSRVVGSVWCRLMDDYGHIDDETPSLAAALYPEYRGQGIGTELLRAMMDALEREGVRQVSLSVQKGNPAVRLYRRVGFRIVRETEEEYIMVDRLGRASSGKEHAHAGQAGGH